MSKRDAKDISTIGPTAQEKTSWTPGSKNSPRQLPYEFHENHGDSESMNHVHCKKRHQTPKKLPRNSPKLSDVFNTLAHITPAKAKNVRNHQLIMDHHFDSPRAALRP